MEIQQICFLDKLVAKIHEGTELLEIEASFGISLPEISYGNSLFGRLLDFNMFSCWILILTCLTRIVSPWRWMWDSSKL